MRSLFLGFKWACRKHQGFCTVPGYKQWSGLLDGGNSGRTGPLTLPARTPSYCPEGVFSCCSGWFSWPSLRSAANSFSPGHQDGLGGKSESGLSGALRSCQSPDDRAVETRCAGRIGRCKSRPPSLHSAGLAFGSKWLLRTVRVGRELSVSMPNQMPASKLF